MRYFLDFVLRQLVRNPDDIDIRETEAGELITFHVTVHPEDVGRIIGKSGRTIGAIRNLLNAAVRQDHRVVVEIVNPV
jgi:uncharacterized protein